MVQDNQPEKETVSPAERDLASPDREQTAGEQSDVEVGKERTEKPDIPDVQKPELPQEENIPTGGPGDQGQAQPTTAQPQTQEEKTKKIKERLKKPIHTGTPRERVESSEIEGKHNEDVLSQP